MKMRKIIAVAAAALMLCAIIPMGALVSAAAPSFDGYITNGDFENGSSNWDLSSWGTGDISAAAAKEGGYGLNLGGGWFAASQNISLKANKNYTISFWVKGYAVTYVKANGAYILELWPENYADWTYVTYTFNSGDNTAATIELNSGDYSGYVDNVTLAEVKESSFDGYITNGDFENGNDDWDLSSWGTGDISAAAAKEGDYGLNLGGGWFAASQNITLKANTNYTISYWVKGYAVTYVKASNGSYILEKWPDTYADWTYVTYAFNSGNNTAATIELNSGDYSGYVDNVTLAEVKEPSFDGYITNGDFETGDIKGWTAPDWCAGSVSISDSVKYEGDYALALNGGWANVQQALTLKANTVYELSFYYSGRGLFFMKELGVTDGIYLDQINEMTKYTYIFNSGSVTSATLEISAPDGLTYYDNVSLAEYECVAHVVEDACMGGVCSICGADVEPAHNVIHVEAKAATCFENGNIEYWTCEDCGQAWLDELCHLNTNLKAVVLPMAHGELTHVEAKEPTCTTEGNIEYWTCEACGYAWLDAEGTQNTNLLAVKLAPSCKYAAVYTAAKAATCYEEGNVEYWYCANCDVYYADADCTIITNAKNVILPITHNVKHVEAKDPTCTELGNIEYWYCEDCGQAWLDELCRQNTNLRAVILPMAEHSYDNDYDVDCNVCGDIRTVEMPITSAGTSVSEDVSGVAALFDIKVEGLAIKDGTKTVADYSNATVDGYKLVSMGVIASNGIDELTIPAKYLYALENGTATYAARIINIPADKYDVEITFQSYFDVEIDGETVRIFGDTVTASYNGVLNR